MKTFLKQISLVLIVVLVSIYMATCSSAASSIIKPLISFDQKSYQNGSLMTLSMKMDGLDPQAKTNSVSFVLQYDNAFELQTGKPETDIKNGLINLTTKYNVISGKNKTINLMYVSMSQDIKLKNNANLFTIKFKVKKDALAGKKTFVLKPVKMYDSSFKAYNVNNGKPYSIDIQVGRIIAKTLEITIINQIRNKDKIIKGKASEGSIIYAKIGKKEFKSTVVKKDGMFSITIPAQKAGTQIILQAKGTNKLSSKEKIIKVIK